jgi:negative regulator of flagellin synthesis FlgM
MAEIDPISAAPVGRVGAVGVSVGRDAHKTEDAAVRRGADRVEVSPVATYLSKLKNLPIRQDLVDSVRGQIADGTYDTPEKLDAAVNELISDHQ